MKCPENWFEKSNPEIFNPQINDTFSIQDSARPWHTTVRNFYRVCTTGINPSKITQHKDIAFATFSNKICLGLQQVLLKKYFIKS